MIKKIIGFILLNMVLSFSLGAMEKEDREMDLKLYYDYDKVSDARDNFDVLMFAVKNRLAANLINKKLTQLSLDPMFIEASSEIQKRLKRWAVLFIEYKKELEKKDKIDNIEYPLCESYVVGKVKEVRDQLVKMGKEEEIAGCNTWIKDRLCPHLKQPTEIIESVDNNGDNTAPVPDCQKESPQQVNETPVHHEQGAKQNDNQPVQAVDVEYKTEEDIQNFNSLMDIVSLGGRTYSATINQKFNKLFPQNNSKGFEGFMQVQQNLSKLIKLFKQYKTELKNSTERCEIFVAKKIFDVCEKLSKYANGDTLAKREDIQVFIKEIDSTLFIEQESRLWRQEAIELLGRLVKGVESQSIPAVNVGNGTKNEVETKTSELKEELKKSITQKESFGSSLKKWLWGHKLFTAGAAAVGTLSILGLVLVMVRK